MLLHMTLISHLGHIYYLIIPDMCSTIFWRRITGIVAGVEPLCIIFEQKLKNFRKITRDEAKQC